MYWWKVPENIRNIVDWGEDLITQNPQSRIFAIGQSMAWIVCAAEITAHVRNDERPFGYIPFSGLYVSASTKPSKNSLCFDRPKATSLENHFPTQEAILFYRNILSGLGIDPLTIVTKHLLNNETTTLCDIIMSGRGLASFLWILNDWAKELNIQSALQEALNIYAFCISGDHPPEYFQLRAHSAFRCQTVQKSLTALTYSLSNSSDEDMDRLLPRYDWSFWNPNKKVFSTMARVENVSLIMRLLKEEVASRCRDSVLSTSNSLRLSNFSGTAASSLMQLQL